MSLRKRVAQLAAVAGLAAVGMSTSPKDAVASGTTYCSTGCAGLAHCNTKGGGTCAPIECMGIDGRLYSYTLNCYNEA